MNSIANQQQPVPLKEQVYAVMTLKQAERFWRYVQVCAHEATCTDCCWTWQGATTSKLKYGHYSVGTKQAGYQNLGTHRLAWVLVYGDVPPGLWILHRCDNPRCCNPAHLWVGTTAENTIDSVQKGRRARGDHSGARRHPERRPRGERHGRARLTDEQVYAIRNLQGKVPGKMLAQKFGTSPSNISGIQRRKHWTHLPELAESYEESEQTE